jgi:hypothetical protein
MSKSKLKTAAVTLPMETSLHIWLKSIGAASRTKKTAIFRIINLALDLARESINRPIDFLEPWELDVARESLNEFRLESNDINKAWTFVIDTNAQVAQKIKDLRKDDLIRLIFYVLNNR